MRRHQGGIPMWRALGGAVQMELEGAPAVYLRDRTAVWLDARPAAERRHRGEVPGATPVAHDLAGDPRAMRAALADGTLPVDDRGRRIVVLATTPTKGRVIADALVREAFTAVSFFAGPPEDIPEAAGAPEGGPPR